MNELHHYNTGGGLPGILKLVGRIKNFQKNSLIGQKNESCKSVIPTIIVSLPSTTYDALFQFSQRVG